QAANGGGAFSDYSSSVPSTPQHKSARDAHRDHRCLQHAHAHPQAVKAPLEYFHSKYATADAKQHPLALLEAMLRTLSSRERQDAQKCIQATCPVSNAGKKKGVHRAPWAKEKPIRVLKIEPISKISTVGTLFVSIFFFPNWMKLHMGSIFHYAFWGSLFKSLNCPRFFFPSYIC
ncbi:unnamed protein product, partial [Tetraodon nigroviridis]